MRKKRLALLDLYDNTPNQGMRAIRELLDKYADRLDYKIFDVRAKEEVPGLEFDLYLSSGGPGDPREGNGRWEQLYFNWLDNLWQHNQRSDRSERKSLFLICHSFQMACYHFGVAEVTKRRTGSFGTFPVHKTPAGKKERFFETLPNPFTVADFRSYQVVQPNEEVFERMGASILALEKIRPHVKLERAIMAIRFSDEIFGTQFHPEADPEGMLVHFNQADRRKKIIDEHGASKYYRMMRDLREARKIPLTHATILPAFIESNLMKPEAVIGQRITG